MLLRFDPFAEFDRMTRGANAPATGFMAADGYRQDDTFVLHLDLPGVDSDSIDMTIEKNALTVSVERTWERSEELQLMMQERPTGTFTRRFFLGEALDTDNVEAGYDHGVLTITIPVREQAKARKIAVGHADKALTG